MPTGDAFAGGTVHPGPPPPVLEVSDLHVTFPGTRPGRPAHAVRGLSYTLHRGEVLGLVGESGAGKSVSALAAIGLLPEGARARGSVRLHGEELLGRSDRAWRRIRGAKIAMVFQDPLTALTPVHTVGHQIAEALRIHDRSLGAARAGKEAAELLGLVGFADAGRRRHAYPHELSGGMRQRVVIAMAIANRPDVLLCDEPTADLDVTVQAQMMELLRTVRRETGAAILLSAHDMGVVAGLADRVAVMYAGRTVEAGGVEEVFARPRMPYTIGLLGSLAHPEAESRKRPAPIRGAPPPPDELPPGCAFAPRCPLRLEECTAAEPRLPAESHAAACVRADEVAARFWRAEDVFPPRRTEPPSAESSPRERAPAVLRVSGLVRSYAQSRPFGRRSGAVRAVDEVSFDLGEGRTLALVGESGAGKSTILREIAELARPRSGRLEILGRDTARMTRGQRKAVRREVQMVFQDPSSSLDPRLPVFDTVAEPLRLLGLATAELPGRVEELLHLVGLAPSHAFHHPGELSGGQCQRVGIARALASQPRLLLLDEPVSALDLSVRAEVLDLLSRLQSRLGTSYLMVSHDLAAVRHIAERVAVLYLGRVVEIGEVERVCAAPAHPYTRALLSAVPVPVPEVERSRPRILLEGDPSDPAAPDGGCRFRNRCPLFRLLTEHERGHCRSVAPQVHPLGAGDHSAACHFAERSLPPARGSRTGG